MPASGISSELSAHQMARPGAIAHSRPTKQPSISLSNAFLSFLSSFVSPLLPLGLGFLLARGNVRSHSSCRFGFVFRKWDQLLRISCLHFPFRFLPRLFLCSPSFRRCQGRRHRCRLLRQRLNFSTPSRVVVTSDLAGSGRHWSPSDWQSETLLLQALSRIPGDDSSNQSTAHAETCSVIAEREKRLRRRAESHTFLNPTELTVLKVQSTVLPLQRGIDWRIHLVLL